MNKETTLNDIPEAEVRFYMFMQEFSITKGFLFALLLFSALGFLLDKTSGIAWAIVIVSIFKFILIPLITLVGLYLSEKYQPEDYKALIAKQRREYYKKHYAE